MTNAADLKDVREALGYASWDLFGVSYGSRLAQEAMRRDPGGVHSAVLASPMLPGGVMHAEGALSYQESLYRVFDACAADAACAKAFPSPKEDFEWLYGELTARPIDVPVVVRDRPSSVRLDGWRFVRTLRNIVVTRPHLVPMFLHELRRGDRGRTARLLVAGSAEGSLTFNNTLTELVGCYEAFGSEYARMLQELTPRIDPAFRSLLNDAKECAIWQETFADRATRAMIISDIPTLILTTQFDDRTTTTQGRRVLAGLTHGYLFEFPGRGHGQFGGACVETIVFAFLADSSRAPDSACIDDMERISLETTTLERPALSFAISADDGRATPFEGKWEAVFPGAPRLLVFNLETRDGRVTGTIAAGAQLHQIIDGRVDERTIVFRVRSPDQDRIVTFSGTIGEARIAFTRGVEVKPGGNEGGASIFGVSGAREFVATRVR